MAVHDPDIIPIVETKRQKLLAISEKQKNNNPSTRAIKEQFLLISQNPDFWKLYTPSEKSLIYRELIKSVVCDCGSVTINFKI